MRPVGPDAGVLGPLLDDLRRAILRLQNPNTPVQMFACATADMPPASDWRNAMLFNTTLGILAVSNGTDWLRQDTGAAI